VRTDQSPDDEWANEGLALPSPAGWTELRLPVWLKFWIGFMAVMTLGGAAGAAWAFWKAQPAAGILLAVLAVFLGQIVGLATRAWWPLRRSNRVGTLIATRDGTKGVTFTYSGWPYYSLTTVLAICELAALALTAALAASATVVGVASAVVVGALVLATGWLLATMLRLAPGRVIVSPAGVYHRSLTSTHFIPWYAIVAVSAHWLGTRVIVVKAYPSEDTRVRRYMGRFFSGGEVQFLPFMVIRTTWLATDPATVYHALSFYHAHPDLRAELATLDAVQRIRNGRAVGRAEPNPELPGGDAQPTQQPD
jgi:hypothetical protein